MLNVSKITMAMAALPLAMAAPGAAETWETMDVTIPYADLNLESQSGQKALERRIERTAVDFCRLNQHQTGTRIQSHNATKCYNAFMASAQRQFAALKKEYRLGG